MKTDAELKKDVIAELDWEPSIDAAEIVVEVENQVVALRGRVGSLTEKWEAERAALRVAGVKAATVEIDVLLPRSSARSDLAIADAGHSALRWTLHLMSNSVRLTVDKGWITLTGHVDWPFQRQYAVRAVRHLKGVLGVTDNLSVRPVAASNGVQSDIEAAIARRLAAAARTIAVEVDGADVTLSGTAQSRFEHDLAIDAARAAPGVTSVVDKMIVIC